MDSIYKEITKWIGSFRFIWNYLIIFYQWYLQKSGNFVRQKFLVISDIFKSNLLKYFFFLFYMEKFLCWTLDVSRTTSYEITRLSVLRSLSFLKIGSLVFSDIVQVGSWPWYLVTDGTRFMKKKFKKIGGPNLGQMGQNWAQN